jgi:hypothetical protein
MSELDEIEMERQEAGGLVQQFVCSAPKKNHEGMVQLAKEFTDIFTKHGEYFQLSNTREMVVITNSQNCLIKPRQGGLFGTVLL